MAPKDFPYLGLIVSSREALVVGKAGLQPVGQAGEREESTESPWLAVELCS